MDAWRVGQTVEVLLDGTPVEVTLTRAPTLETYGVLEDRWQASLDLGDGPLLVWVIGPSARQMGRVLGEVV